jgi:phage host-nuclease inhibitor protein Gam
MSKTREYADVAKHQIDQIATEIERLQERADKAVAELRSEYEQRIKDLSTEYDREFRSLRQMRYDAEAKVSSLMDAGESAAEEIRFGIDAAINEMNAALVRAGKQLKKR